MMTTNQLLSAADRLPDEELDELAQQLNHLAAKRRCVALPARETELLQQINQEPDCQRVRRYQELRTKRDSGPLDEPETEELLALSDWLEETHAERLGAIAELAQLRGLSLSELMKQLGIRHLLT